MKGKWKYLLYTVIVLDLVYIGFYGYNKYIRIPMSRTSRAAIANSDSTSVSTEFIIPFDYGDTVKNHSLTDAAGKIIDISPANKNFKFLKIIQLSNPDNINIDYFSSFIDIVKEFIDKDMIFIYLNVVEFSDKKKKELSKIQEKFKIHIASITNEFMKNYYNLPNCRCGFTLLLDDKNRVRIANFNLGYELTKNLIKNELMKEIVYNERK